jgi:hypothetical protein
MKGFKEDRMSDHFDPFERMSQLDTQGHSWLETWKIALAQPTEEGYRSIAEDPGRSANQGYLWVFLSALIGYVFTILVSGLLGTDMFGTDLQGLMGVSLLFLLCFAPVGGVFAILGLIVSAGLTQWMAGMFGGKGRYADLVYVQGAYMAPLSLVSSLIAGIPFVNCLALPLGLYALYLNILAIKVVNRFGWGSAIATWVALLVLMLFLVGCLVAAVVVLLGPAVEGIFEEIMQGM